MVQDSGVTGIPRLQENVTEENRIRPMRFPNLGKKHQTASKFNKKAPTGFSLRFLDSTKRRTDLILGFSQN